MFWSSAESRSVFPASSRLFNRHQDDALTRFQGRQKQDRFPAMNVYCYIDGKYVDGAHLGRHDTLFPFVERHTFDGAYVIETEKRLFRFTAPVSGIAVLCHKSLSSPSSPVRGSRLNRPRNCARVSPRMRRQPSILTTWRPLWYNSPDRLLGGYYRTKRKRRRIRGQLCRLWQLTARISLSV
jgi:hypothetical protein